MIRKINCMILSSMIAAIMMLSLASCGDSASASSAPASLAPAMESIAVDPAVQIPSLEEVTDDIYQYAENADMQISEDAMTAIFDMYDTGTTDAYSIFEYLCSNGLCVPKSNGVDITAGPILMQGSFQTGFTAAQMNLSTGELETVFHFINSNNYTFAFDPAKQNYMSCYFTQQLFNEDMTKLAVSWWNSTDSAQHVGWIDREGNLTDVTAKIHPHTTDFSSKIPHDNYALFSPDGYFVFTDLDKECYCFLDVNSMSVVKEVPYIVDDSSHYSKEFGNNAYQIIFMPNGELRAMWHAKSSVENIRDFGNCYIDLPNSSDLKTWDYLYDNKILCVGHDAEGYFIAEIGEEIGELSSLDHISRFEGINCWNYAYHGTFTDKDGIVTLKITPHTDYRLESCAYSNGQIAFIGSRGSERFLFTVEETENSNPNQIAPIDSSWQLLFWKGARENRNYDFLTGIQPTTKDEKIVIEHYSAGQSYSGETYSHYLYSNLEGSTVTWNLGGKYSRLTGLWTICHGEGGATSEESFEVYADGMLVYTSPALIGQESSDVSVSIDNCNELKIVFTKGVGWGELANVTLHK